MSKKFSSPKRRIERIRNRIDILLTSGAVSVNLHVAEDAKTLVRTIVDLVMTHVSGSAEEADWHLLIQRAEGSVRIVEPTIANSLDNVAPQALIWENSGSLDMVTAAGNGAQTKIEYDGKGMRKMKENDTVELTHLASTASILRVVGTITLLFKE